MTVWSLSVHMLCGLFMLSCGRATFFDTVQFSTSMAVAVPGLVLAAVSSNWVSTQTSPTPGTAGFTLPGGRTVGSWKYPWKNASSEGSSVGVPSAFLVRMGAVGYTGSQVTDWSGR